MTRNNQPFSALPGPSLNWSKAGTPSSKEFGDVYYSLEQGPAESTHTFLEGNGLPGRWHSHPRRHFCIMETGFGTGLNFLLTWHAWQLAAEPKPDLQFISVERYPLHHTDMQRAHSHWRQLSQVSEGLLAACPAAIPGCHRVLMENGRVRLDLYLGDVEEVALELASREQAIVDAWYLDGFAPAKNADMWSPKLMQAAARLSHPGATVATFTAAGAVRRALDDAGFSTQKVAGFGRKREALRAQAPASTPRPAATREQTPWDIPQSPAAVPEQVIVIGAGLAGCWTAHTLARRGVEVTLLEQNTVASAASGNEQGIVYTRLSHKHSPLVDFALLAFQFAGRCYTELFDSGELTEGIDGKLCGALQLLPAHTDLERMREPLSGLEQLARIVSATEASALAGVALPANAYWFPQSGWLHPPALCQRLSQTPGVTLQEQLGQLRLKRTADAWQVQAADGHSVANAPCVVIATGTGCSAFAELAWLPLRPVRGQTTQLPPGSLPTGLKVALCHEGYIAPARQGAHCIGASFNLHSEEAQLCAADHGENLDKLAAAVPTWESHLAALKGKSLAGRVGFRCTTPDYLPVVGPVPEQGAFMQAFRGLADNAKRVIDARAPCVPGLYANTGHGSRGLTTTPLAAELLASMICGESPPLERELCRAISPARFLVRDLARSGGK